MSEVRETFGPAGYGAVWLLLERIAESWSGSALESEPELCLSLKEWTKTCELSGKKLQELLTILQQHNILRAEIVGNRVLLQAPILLELQDEWTSRTRRNSKATTEPLGSNSGIQQTRTDKEKNRDRHEAPPMRFSLFPVLLRHHIPPESERARRIIRHMEEKQARNPAGYLESILKQKPGFDPMPENSPEQRQTGQAASAAEVLYRLGLQGANHETPERKAQ